MMSSLFNHMNRSTLVSGLLQFPDRAMSTIFIYPIVGTVYSSSSASSPKPEPEPEIDSGRGRTNKRDGDFYLSNPIHDRHLPISSRRQKMSYTVHQLRVPLVSLLQEK